MHSHDAGALTHVLVDVVEGHLVHDMGVAGIVEEGDARDMQIGRRRLPILLWKHSFVNHITNNSQFFSNFCINLHFYR